MPFVVDGAHSRALTGGEVWKVPIQKMGFFEKDQKSSLRIFSRLLYSGGGEDGFK